MRAISRRGFILAAPVFLGGCVTQGARLAAPSRRLVDPDYKGLKEENAGIPDALRTKS